MSVPRLKAWIWVQAQVMACNRLAIPSTVVKKGHKEAGAILLKLNRGMAGCEVLSQVRDAAGDLAWFRSTGPDLVVEADADALIGRELSFDPDLWVIEIEDPKGLYELDGALI